VWPRVPAGEAGGGRGRRGSLGVDNVEEVAQLIGVQRLGDVLIGERVVGAAAEAGDRERREELSAVPSESLARSLTVFDEAPVDSHENIPYGSSRYLYLALEAYREGKISLGKLAEILGIGIEEVRDLVWELQVEPEVASAEEAVV